MAGANPTFILQDVEALHPRLNGCYRFDKAAGEKGRSVPCEPQDDNAKYEMSFRMSKEKAAQLYAAMTAAYGDRKAANWPEMPEVKDVFTKDETGLFVAKAVLKGMYNGEVTKPPRQFDARNNPLPKDFRLTTGSTVNSEVALVPYSMRENGVSLRLKAVQVVKLVEMQESASSPFAKIEDGFDAKANGDDFTSSFGDTTESDPAPVTAPAPKTGPAGGEAKAETATVDDFNDIDAALANLDFDD